MKIVTTGSIYAFFIFEAILVSLGFGLSILFQGPIYIVGWILFVVGWITLLWGAYIYTNTKNNVIEYFSACPLCGKPNTLIKLAWGFSLDDTHEVVCQDCGAKWIIKTSGWTGSIRIVKLVKPSDDGNGEDYLGKETDPEFWITIARKRKQERG